MKLQFAAILLSLVAAALALPTSNPSIPEARACRHGATGGNFPLPEQSWAGTFSPDGDLISAGAGDQTERIWSVDSGQLLHSFSGFGGWIRSLVSAPDGLELATGSDGGTEVIFYLNSGERA
ncbi:hypothetical protein B0H13DRAFT_2655106 [Mycena leptocephala]|nr:hypothetical protein B0H13DRAFT_2655106 [Mycena leptocephala]